MLPDTSQKSLATSCNKLQGLECLKFQNSFPEIMPRFILRLLPRELKKVITKSLAKIFSKIHQEFLFSISRAVERLSMSCKRYIPHCPAWWYQFEPFTLFFHPYFSNWELSYKLMQLSLPIVKTLGVDKLSYNRIALHYINKSWEIFANSL